jgi:hypothetical protein
VLKELISYLLTNAIAKGNLGDVCMEKQRVSQSEFSFELEKLSVKFESLNDESINGAKTKDKQVKDLKQNSD